MAAEKSGSRKKKQGRNKRMGRKAQITIFIVIGFIVLAVFVLLNYATSQDDERNVKKQQEETAQSVLDLPVVNGYVTRCAQDALENGIIILAHQGGAIYTDQGSIIHDLNAEERQYLPYRGFRVAYGI